MPARSCVITSPTHPDGLLLLTWQRRHGRMRIALRVIALGVSIAGIGDTESEALARLAQPIARYRLHPPEAQTAAGAVTSARSITEAVKLLKNNGFFVIETE